MGYKSGAKLTSFAFILIFIITIFIMNLMLVSPVYAHRVVTYAYVEGEKIVVEGAFGDGAPIKEGEVKVYDQQDKLLKEGKTNESGVYKFEIPQKSDLKIVVGGEMGHQAEYIIKEEELPEMNFVKPDETDSAKLNQTTEELSTTDKKSSMTENEQATEKDDQTNKDKSVSKEKLRSILQEELDKRIGPLNKKITQLQQKKGPGVTEILGGIGYIFGLMGIAFYFKAKGE